MGLPPFFPRTQKKDESRKFLALEIGSEAITAGLWVAGSEGVEILKHSSQIQWSGEDVKDAVEAADVALEELGQEASQIDDVMLGLRSDWVDDSGITNTRKPFIKALKDELQLNPIGFVVTDEALTHYLKDIEGAPLTAFLLRYSESQLQLSLVSAGKIEAQEFIGRSGDAIADLSEGFARMQSFQFPSRILLSAERMKKEQLEEEKSALLEHGWKSGFPFQHDPKIEVLEPLVMISAVCVAGGSEVARALGIVEEPIPEEKTAQEHNASNKQDPISQDASIIQSDPLPAPTPPTSSFSVEIEEEPMLEQTQPSIEEEPIKNQSAESQTSLETHSQAPQPAPMLNHPEQMQPIEEALADTDENPSAVRKNPISIVMQKTLKFFSSIAQNLKNKKSNRHVNPELEEALRIKKFQIKTLLPFIVILLVLGAGTGGYVYAESLLRGSITIKLKPQPVVKESSVKIDLTTSTLEIDEQLIPIEIAEDVIEGKKSSSTTGKSKVGEKATGSVLIYNRTSSKKALPKNTKLTTPTGLAVYTLDDIEINASSTGADFSIQPGKTEAKVIADKIGTEYNIASGTEFSVANFDKISFIASNAQSFSGGSSSDVQVVAKLDQTNLESSLKKDLLAEPVEKKSNTISLDISEVKSAVFSHDVGEETSDLDLSMEIARKSAVISEDALLQLVQTMFASEIATRSINLDSIDLFPIENSQSVSKSVVTLKLGLRTLMIPSFSSERIASQVPNRTVDQVNTLLGTYKEIESFSVSVSPKILGTVFGKMPKKIEFIQITVEK